MLTQNKLNPGIKLYQKYSLSDYIDDTPTTFHYKELRGSSKQILDSAYIWSIEWVKYNESTLL